MKIPEKNPRSSFYGLYNTQEAKEKPEEASRNFAAFFLYFDWLQVTPFSTNKSLRNVRTNHSVKRQYFPPSDWKQAMSTKIRV